MQHRFTRRNGPLHAPTEEVERIRFELSRNLHLDPAFIKLGRLGHAGQLGTEDPHWMFYWRGRWRELPWHFNGVLCVDWNLIRRWYGPFGESTWQEISAHPL